MNQKMTAVLPREVSRTPSPAEGDQENRQPTMEIVVYENVNRQMVEPLRRRQRRLELLTLFACIGLTYGVWFALKRGEQVRTAELAQSRSVIKLTTVLSNQKGKIDELSEATNELTAAVAQVASKQNALSDVVAVQHKSVDRLNAEVRVIISRTRKTLNQSTTESANVSVERSPENHHPNAASLNGAELVAEQHHHTYDLSIPLPGGIIGHLDAERKLDYWMIIRVLGSGHQETVRAIPYETNSLGIAVHSLEDGKDYTVKNGWLEERTGTVQ
jgi:uncharacterized coiled-coil protein SlyX